MRTAKRQTAKKQSTKPTRAESTKQAVRRTLPALRPAEPASPDRMLLLGGLALVVLVLADTVFLTLSRRRVSA